MTTYGEAVTQAIEDELRTDSTVALLAPEIPVRFAEQFGSDRVRLTPASEAAVAGIALGMAVSGFRPVVSWSCATFAFVAFDQLVNQMAKIRYLSGGQFHAPLVVRLRYFGGARMAAQHTATTFAMYGQVPGLKVVAPATAEDAYGLMRAAIRDDDPVLFFEADSLRDQPRTTHSLSGAIGKALVLREGSEVSVIAMGAMVPAAVEVASRFEADTVEVVDLRSLAPLDLATIRASVKKTGRLVLVDESTPRCSFASELITSVVEDATIFPVLRTAPVRICSQDVVAPYSPPLEDHVRPSLDRIEAVLQAVLSSSSPSQEQGRDR